MMVHATLDMLNKQRAKYYSLPAAGKKALAEETRKWEATACVSKASHCLRLRPACWRDALSYRYEPYPSARDFCHCGNGSDPDD